MNITALALSAAGLVAVMVTWIAYMAAVPRNAVPERPVGSVLVQLTGIGLSAGGVGWGLRADALGVGIIAMSTLSVIMAALFLFLLSQRKTPVGAIKVNVGDPLPPFELTTAEGDLFRSRSLAGQRLLLKFFRGSW